MSPGPKRLSETGPPELRSAIRHGQHRGPSDAQMAGARRALAAALVAGSAGAGTGVAVAQGTSWTLPKWLALGVTVSALGGGGYWVVEGSKTPEPPGSLPAAVSSAPPIATELFEAAPAEDLKVPAVVPSIHKRQPVTKKRVVEAPSTPPSELELLREAKAALNSSPSRALRLVKEHRAAYPRGVMAQERDIIEFDALRRLGNKKVADRAGRSLLKRYPGSVHQRRVEAHLRSESEASGKAGGSGTLKKAE